MASKLIILMSFCIFFQFMKRTALKEIKKESEEDQRIDDQHWVLDMPQLTEKE